MVPGPCNTSEWLHPSQSARRVMAAFGMNIYKGPRAPGMGNRRDLETSKGDFFA